MDDLRQDLRFSLRSLLRAPIFTFVAVVTLALGIGANSAVFSVVDAVVLRALPFPDADRFVHVGWNRGAGPSNYTTGHLFEWIRERTTSLDAVATYRGFTAKVGPPESVEGVPALRVSSEFFDALGYAPAIGRTFDDAEHDRGAAVAVVTPGFWNERFGGDPQPGGSIEIDGESWSLVGVLPADFQFPLLDETPRLITPLDVPTDPRDEGQNWPVVARLADGVSKAAASDELARVYAAYRASFPTLGGEETHGLELMSFRQAHLAGVETTLWVLVGAIALVLVIACANVANLLLARGTDRRGELAVRAALGAGRGRIVRQLLTESVVLALAGGALGILLAHVGTDALLALLPDQLPRADSVGVHGRVLAFTLAASLLSGLAFGLVAAVPVGGATSASVLNQGARGGRVRTRGRQILVAAEAALAVVLLVGAGLLLGTFVRLNAVDPGFRSDGVWTVRFPWTPEGYAGSAARVELERSLVERVGASAGIRDIAMASVVPLSRGLNIPMAIQGHPDKSETAVELRYVTPGYFETLGIPLSPGRALSPADDAGAPPVAIVNRAFAEHYFPDASALGERIDIGMYRGRFVHPAFEGPGWEIVGVVGDVRESSLRRPAKRTIFIPLAQVPDQIANIFGMPTVIVKAGTGTPVAATLRSELRQIDPFLPEPRIQPLESLVDDSLARERFNAILMSIFAGLALFLTAFGVYGVVSYSARRRTREIGIRIAIGARAGEVSRTMTLQGMGPVLVGLIVGLAGALAGGRVLASLVWGVEPTDPVTLMAVGSVMAVTALLASWIPARAASRTDPVEALRSE